MGRFIGSRCAEGLLALVVLTWAGAAAAQASEVEDRRFYIAPLVSYSFFDEDSFEPDDDVGGQFSIGKRVSDHLALELFVSYFTDVDLERGLGDDATFDETSYGLGALFFPVPSLLPIYGIVAVGEGEYDFDDRDAGPAGLNDQEAEFYDVGVGLLMPLTDYGIALRAEYRYRSREVDAPNTGDSYRFRNDVVSLGVQIPLGAKPEPQPVAAPPLVPRAAGVAPSDADGDGVIDRWDECPDTPLDSAVDSNGCPVEVAVQTIILKGVTFEFDTAALTRAAERNLDLVVESLKTAKQVDIKVAGHTDSIGPAAYNQKLSLRRAASVKTYLVNHGIDPDRISTVGYGETRPIAPNEEADGSDNPTGRAMNRRVELHVVEP